MIRKQTTKKKLDPQALRRWIVLGATVLVVALTGMNIWLVKNVKKEAVKTQQTQAEQTAPAGEADMDHAHHDHGAASEPTLTSPAAIGGDFSGTDHLGKPFTFSQTNGRLRLVFFGFTHCPDICPTSLTALSEVQASLGEKSNLVAPVFVTVDPARDTSEVLKEYLSSFHPSITAVTGSEEQIKQATNAFKVFYSAAEPDAGGNYNVNHSGFIYLLDGKGTYLSHFAYDENPSAIIEKINEHLPAS